MVERTVNIPIGIRFVKNKLFVICLPTKPVYFTESFFIDSLVNKFKIPNSQVKLPDENELLVRPVHLGKTAKIERLISEQEFIRLYRSPNLSVKIGFIFHMSRCGSTLATQMLTVNKRFFVLSEPSVINVLLDPGLALSKIRRKHLIVSCVHALSLAAPTRCEHIFIKFRSWNSLYMRQLLKWFPRVPWLFIHRYGLEVLQSVREDPPGWMRSRKTYARYFKSFLGSNIRAIHNMSDDEYAARMLGSFCQIASEIKSTHKKFIEYTNLKKIFPSILSSLFGIELTKSEKRNIFAVSCLYSKNTTSKRRVLFKPDSLGKRSRAGRIQRELTNRFIEVNRLKLLIV